MVAGTFFNSSCDTKLNIELLYMKGFPHQSFWIQLVSFQINKSTDLSKLIPIPLHIKNCYQWQHPLPPIYYHQYTTTRENPSLVDLCRAVFFGLIFRQLMHTLSYPTMHYLTEYQL